MTCQECSAELPVPLAPTMARTPRRFCGSVCALKRRRRLARAERGKEVSTICKLASCGQPLPPQNKTGRFRLFCNPRCQRADREIRDRVEQQARRAAHVCPPMAVLARYGKLVVQEIFDIKARLECDCGRDTLIELTRLLDGSTRDCGCGRRAAIAANRENKQRGIHTSRLRGNGRRGGRPRKTYQRIGVRATSPDADNMDEVAVLYVVTTREQETVHDTFDEAREEYLLRTRRAA